MLSALLPFLRPPTARRPGGPTERLKPGDAGAALEGSRDSTLGGSRLSLTESVEVGLRHDGRDAEDGNRSRSVRIGRADQQVIAAEQTARKLRHRLRCSLA